MSLKVDRLQLEIIINNDQARKSLRALDDEARSIQKSMKGLKEGSDEWIQSTKRLNSIKSQMDTIHDSIGITGLSMKELNARQKEFNMLLSNMNPNLPQYKEYEKTLGQVNARITELRGKTKDASAAMNQQGGTFSELFTKMKTYSLELGAAALAAFSLNALKNYVKGGIEAALKLRDTEALLLEELNGQKAVQTDLINLAKKRSNHTKYGRLEIEEAEKFLAIQERSPEQIKKTIVAAINLAAITGGSLNDAVKDLDATLEGRLGKGLGKLEKDFKGLTKEQMYNGEAIDIVAKKYAGLAEREMNTTEGRVILLGKAWKALQRTLGETLIDGGMFDSIIIGATSLLNSFKKLIEIPLSEKIMDERDSLNSLVFQIQATNSNQAQRNKLLDELRVKYPDFLGNLTNEQASNERLAATLSNVNQQYVEKIRLANSEEQLKDLAEVQEKASRKLSKAEQDRNEILSKSMDLLWQSNAAAAKMVEMAPTLDEKIALVKKHFGGTGGTGAAFLVAAQQAKEASKSMNEAQRDFTTESLKIAEEGVRSALNLTNSLDSVSNQLLNMALQTKDVNLKAIIQTEIADRQSQERMSANRKKDYKVLLEYTKMSEDQLNEILSRAREDSATNIDRTNSRHAQDELNRRKKTAQGEEVVAKAYEQYMDLMREIASVEKTNFAEKLTQTQGEIKAVNDKYDNEIKKIEEFKIHKKETLTPDQSKELDTQIGALEITRDAQTKQVLEQAEKDFADKVKLIHENLRVAKMTITAKQIYDVNKKYDDAEKEILDSIEYRYQQEVIAAKGNTGLLVQAEKDKEGQLAKIKVDIDFLEEQRETEKKAAWKEQSKKFYDDLAALALKSEISLAKGKEKIQLEVQKKYQKLLDDNINSEKKTNQIKVQMAEEIRQKEAEEDDKARKKYMELAIKAAQTLMNSLSTVSSAWSDYQNAMMARDQEDNDKKKAALKRQLDSKLITQKQYDSSIARLDEEADKKKRKLAHDQAVTAKATNVTNAIINTAVGVTAALSLEPVGIALAIIVGLLGAAQVALILATPVPQAATGRYNVTGSVDGRKYNNVPYLESFTGIPGHPMLVNETGNEIVIDPYTTRNLQMNYPHIIEGINQARVPQRSSGLYPDTHAQRTAAEGPLVVKFDAETLQSMHEFKEQLKKPLGANIVYDDMRNSMATVALLEKSVTR